jgi:hypothetical protein
MNPHDNKNSHPSRFRLEMLCSDSCVTPSGNAARLISPHSGHILIMIALVGPLGIAVRRWRTRKANIVNSQIVH